MKKNMNNTDKIIRVTIAALIAVLYLTGVLKGITGIVLLVVAVILAVTSLLGYCPLYSLLGLSTNKKER